MKNIVTLACLMLAMVLSASEIIHIQVVDADGAPLEGVKLQVDWRKRKNNANEDGEASYQCRASIFTDRNGCSRIYADENNWDFEIGAILKDGYRYENDLNRNRGEELDPGKHTKDHPFRVVLRKLQGEKANLLWMRPLRKRTIGTKTRDAKFDVDLFETCLGQEHGDRRKAYVDFSVVAHFDENVRRWNIAFQTENDDTGIIATTNRVYMAPTIGYAKRVEVSQEMYVDESFTIYLHTRKPKVYAMLVFGPDLRARTDDYTSFSFDYDHALINPTGSPLMELDEAMSGSDIMRGYGRRCLTVLLEEHRYPPRPDMKARLDNRRKWQELEDESNRLAAQIKKYGEEKELLGKNNNGLTQEVQENYAQVKRKIRDDVQKMRNCALEQSRLDQEILGLFLSENTEEKVKWDRQKSEMTEKDKYPKKTQ